MTYDHSHHGRDEIRSLFALLNVCKRYKIQWDLMFLPESWEWYGRGEQGVIGGSSRGKKLEANCSDGCFHGEVYILSFKKWKKSKVIFF